MLRDPGMGAWLRVLRQQARDLAHQCLALRGGGAQQCKAKQLAIAAHEAGVAGFVGHRHDPGARGVEGGGHTTVGQAGVFTITGIAG